MCVLGLGIFEHVQILMGKRRGQYTIKYKLSIRSSRHVGGRFHQFKANAGLIAAQFERILVNLIYKLLTNLDSFRALPGVSHILIFFERSTSSVLIVVKE